MEGKQGTSRTLIKLAHLLKDPKQLRAENKMLVNGISGSGFEPSKCDAAKLVSRDRAGKAGACLAL